MARPLRIEFPDALYHVTSRGKRLLDRVRLEQLFPPGVLADRALRNDRIREANRSRGHSLVDISRHLGLHYSTVSRIAAGRTAVGRRDRASGDRAGDRSMSQSKT